MDVSKCKKWPDPKARAILAARRPQSRNKSPREEERREDGEGGGGGGERMDRPRKRPPHSQARPGKDLLYVVLVVQLGAKLEFCSCLAKEKINYGEGLLCFVSHN